MRMVLLLLTSAALFTLYGCAMLTAWRASPPPGGCDQCHTVAIATDWQVAYQPVKLTTSAAGNTSQTSEYSMPQTAKPGILPGYPQGGGAPCFECHKEPTPAHKGRKGKFHHTR